MVTLDAGQIEVLLNAVNTQFYGVNDETDLLTILANMMRMRWPDVPIALLAQACWMYLGTLEETDNIAIAKEYFEECFQNSLEEFLEEYME